MEHVTVLIGASRVNRKQNITRLIIKMKATRLHLNTLATIVGALAFVVAIAYALVNLKKDTPNFAFWALLFLSTFAGWLRLPYYYYDANDESASSFGFVMTYALLEGASLVLHTYIQGWSFRWPLMALFTLLTLFSMIVLTRALMQKSKPAA